MKVVPKVYLTCTSPKWYKQVEGQCLIRSFWTLIKEVRIYLGSQPTWMKSNQYHDFNHRLGGCPYRYIKAETQNIFQKLNFRQFLWLGWSACWYLEKGSYLFTCWVAAAILVFRERLLSFTLGLWYETILVDEEEAALDDDPAVDDNTESGWSWLPETGGSANTTERCLLSDRLWDCSPLAVEVDGLTRGTDAIGMLRSAATGIVPLASVWKMSPVWNVPTRSIISGSGRNSW